jgi:hypothetical protein
VWRWPGRRTAATACAPLIVLKALHSASHNHAHLAVRMLATKDVALATVNQAGAQYQLCGAAAGARAGLSLQRALGCSQACSSPGPWGGHDVGAAEDWGIGWLGAGTGGQGVQARGCFLCLRRLVWCCACGWLRFVAHRLRFRLWCWHLLRGFDDCGACGQREERSTGQERAKGQAQMCCIPTQSAKRVLFDSLHLHVLAAPN